MIYSIDNRELVTEDNIQQQSADKSVGIPASQWIAEGRLLYIPDYYVTDDPDQFVIRFLRLYGYTENFAKIFPDIQPINEHDAVNKL